jgi:hypothetical protein
MTNYNEKVNYAQAVHALSTGDYDSYHEIVSDADALPDALVTLEHAAAEKVLRERSSSVRNGNGRNGNGHNGNGYERELPQIYGPLYNPTTVGGARAYIRDSFRQTTEKGNYTGLAKLLEITGERRDVKKIPSSDVK